MSTSCDKENFSVVWKQCGEKSRMAERFFVPGFEGYLPFFIWGEALIALERKEAVELNEEQLLKGLLYGLFEFEGNSKPWHQKESKETYLYLIEFLGRGFKYNDLEKLILDTAFNVREINGNGASRIILEVGCKLKPDSSKIVSDLIVDIWALACSVEDPQELIMRIPALTTQIDFKNILPSAKEIICYYMLCATVLLGRDGTELDTVLEKYVYPNVEIPELKVKIKDLLENPAGFTVADLKVT